MKRRPDLKLVGVVLLALLLEVTVFQLSYWHMVISGVECNLTFTLDDFETLNWMSDGSALRSEGGQQLILHDLSTQVKRLRIISEITPSPDYTLVFYTTTANEHFQDSQSILYSESEIKPDVFIQDLRIDFSNQPNLELSSLSVEVNHAQFSFSASRVVAVILIYLFGKLLFALQSPPEYFLEET